MKENNGRGDIEALKMLDVFASVGVQFFDITHTNFEGEKRGFRPKQSLATTRTSMPHQSRTGGRADIERRPSPAPVAQGHKRDCLRQTGAAQQDRYIVAACVGDHQIQLSVAVEVSHRQ